MEIHCSICLCPIHCLPDEDENCGDSVPVTTTCGHIFHSLCLDKARDEFSRCPNCNTYPLVSHRIFPIYEEKARVRLLQKEVEKYKRQCELMESVTDSQKEVIESLKWKHYKVNQELNDYKDSYTRAKTENVQLQAQVQELENKIQYLTLKKEKETSKETNNSRGDPDLISDINAENVQQKSSTEKKLNGPFSYPFYVQWESEGVQKPTNIRKLTKSELEKHNNKFPKEGKTKLPSSLIPCVVHKSRFHKTRQDMRHHQIIVGACTKLQALTSGLDISASSISNLEPSSALDDSAPTNFNHPVLSSSSSSTSAKEETEVSETARPPQRRRLDGLLLPNETTSEDYESEEKRE